MEEAFFLFSYPFEVLFFFWFVLIIMLYLLDRHTRGARDLWVGFSLQVGMLYCQKIIVSQAWELGDPIYQLYGLLLLIVEYFHLEYFKHDLSYYPGPLLWSISRLPQTYYLFRGTLPWKIHELHKRYGPVVRVAPNELSYTNLEAWNDIYGRGEDKRQLRKDTGFTPSAATNVRGIKFELDDGEHARLRYVNFSF